LLTTLMLCLSSRADAQKSAWSGRVYDVSRQIFLTADQIRAGLEGVELLVLGEKHNTIQVQLEQSSALRLALEANPLAQNRWILGWEFLNRRDQKSIDDQWDAYSEGRISGNQLLDHLMGPGLGRTYLPLLEVANAYQGVLRGLNLAREEKAPVVTGGLGAIDPALIPPGFAMGGAFYRERFERAMGSHATPEQMGRYFQAQCLVDDVMAYTLLEDQAELRVEVNGSFHSDYFDGAVARIRARKPSLRLLLIRFIDAADYTEADLSPQLNLAEPALDPKYGPLADWVWFAGEPTTGRRKNN